MATVLEKVQKLTYEENFAMALCQVFTSIKNSIISENLVLLTQNEQFRAKSAHIRPTIVKNALKYQAWILVLCSCFTHIAEINKYITMSSSNILLTTEKKQTFTMYASGDENQ